MAATTPARNMINVPTLMPPAAEEGRERTSSAPK
jgi:hypothetical protein